jgi:beta-galactosidase
MKFRIQKIILSITALIVATSVYGNFDKASTHSGRKVVSLDGTWQIAEGGMDKIPEMFNHVVVVPGLVDMAKPAFMEPGPKVDDRSALSQKDPRRDAFWYRRTFNLSEPVPEVAQLKIGKAMYGTRVFLNRKLIGDHTPCFTQGLFDVKDALKSGENELIIRVGSDRNSVSDLVESGTDGEKSRFIPGIYDNVGLIMSGSPHIINIQAVPDIENKSVTVHAWVKCSPVPVDTKLHITIREAMSRKIACEADFIVAAGSSGLEQTGSKTVPIRGCHLWSPEDPFLYEVEVQSPADNFSTRFGMRSFRLDPATGRAILNGKPYFMRGTNVTLLRFFEDSLRGDKPWNEEWIRLLYKRFHEMNWNSFRLCIGFAPELWYRIADEEGFLIQDEYPVWWGVSTRITADVLAGEFREWMEERWNHPSVVIWDAANETYSPETGKAIKQVRGLDFSNRPWQNGWGEPVDPADADECHPYHFIFGPNQPFRMHDLAKDPGTKAGLLIAQPFANEKLLRKNPVIINEYGGLWLNRDGSTTTLSKLPFDYLMDPSATVSQRRLLYARNMAAITEYFRAHRQAAAVMHFCALGYSRSDGQTSDEWIDAEKLTWDPDFYKYVRDAFAPTGIMLDVWEDEFPAGKNQEFPVVIFNDPEKEWKGEVQFRLSEGGKTIFEKKLPARVDGHGVSRISFMVTIPEKAADYLAEATLIAKPTGSVRSLRDFSVRTPQQSEERRNLVQGRPVKASSVLVKDNNPGSAEFAVDGNRSTGWLSEKGKPQWLTVDLGEMKTISRIELSWNWSQSPKSYLIQVSGDGEVWETVYSTNEGTLSTGTSRFTPTKTRCVRLFLMGKDDEEGYAINDFAVYH